MNLILLGAPGAGKGTQAAKLVEQFKFPHISTGDIFRQNIKDKTPIGLKAKEYIDKGQLVPDEVVISIVEDRIKQPDCQNGYLLDGFPRTVAQAEALDKITTIDKVININVDLEKLANRLEGRRVCSKCGETYNLSSYNFSQCSKCGGDLIQRDDDRPEAINQRLKVYTEQTAPLIDYYKKQNKLITVNGDNTIWMVSQEIIDKLK